MVERVCGIPKAKFEEIAKLFCGNSGPDKTGTITYALNLTQHTNGVENIRALCMLQLLLGNIGRPGGGIVALRGHANVQGATDLELLYHELPGYLPMPLRDAHPDLKTYLEKETPKGGYWVNRPKFMVSLLKAFYGDAATKDNEFGYQWLPKRASADAYSHQHIFVDMYEGKIKGFLADGQNPAVGGPNAKLARAAMHKLDWLVVVDIFLTETAEVWKAPGDRTAKDVKTEVFFMPGRAGRREGRQRSPTRCGSSSGTRRRSTPPGDVQLRRASSSARSRSGCRRCTPAPRRSATRASWPPTSRTATSPTTGHGRGAEGDQRLRHRGHHRQGRQGRLQEGPAAQHVRPPHRRRQDGVGLLDLHGRDRRDAGRQAHQQGGRAQARRREGLPRPRLGLRVAGQPPHHLQPRLGRPRGQAVEREEEAHLVGCRRRPAPKPEDKKGKWVGLDVPDFNPFLAPDAKNGDKPFIMRADLVGGFFGPLNDGPFPEHYEPVESPAKNLLSKTQSNPVVKIWKVPDQKNELAPVGSPDYPYVITTYRLTEHHLSGVMSRYLPMLAELHHSHFAEISHELAQELKIENGEKITVMSPRGKVHVTAMVTNRLKPFLIDGKTIHQIGVPWHWGWNGVRRAARQQGRHHQRPLGHGGRPQRLHPGDEGLRLQREEGGGVAMARTLAMFTDTSLCIGCRACQVACKQWNELGMEVPDWTGSYQNHTHFTDKTFRLVRFIEEPGGKPNGDLAWLLMSDVCKHCADAGCLNACPTGAIYRTEFGTVNINQDVCNGCRYCVSACPFGVVSLQRADRHRDEVHVLQRPHPQRPRPRLRQGVPDRVDPVRLPRRAGGQGAEARRDAEGDGLQGGPALRRRLQGLPRRAERVLPPARQAGRRTACRRTRSCPRRTSSSTRCSRSAPPCWSASAR